MDYALPIAYALLLWWFATGLIFYLDQLPVRTFKWSMAGGTAVLGVALGPLLWKVAINDIDFAATLQGP